jgi:hypothetical protein
MEVLPVNGLNKMFMDDPDGFMNRYSIDIPYEGNKLSSGDNCPAASIYQFDLYEDSSKDCVFLRLASERTEATTCRTHFIKAYWLPWKSKSTESMELGNQADFFFTSALGGCRIQVAGKTVVRCCTAKRIPVVAHISGDFSRVEREDKGQKFEQRDDLSGKSRRFSSTQDYGAQGEDAMAFFVGYKKKGNWSFLGQKHDIDEHTLKYSTIGLNHALGGTLWKAEGEELF